MAARPGDSTPPVRSTPVTDATHAAAGTTPTVGSVYRGTVRSRETDGTYTVAIDAPRMALSGVLLAAPVFGGLLGFNVRCRIIPGTEVELSYGNPSFIHAIIPRNTTDWLNAKNRSMVWGDAVEELTGDYNNFSDAPEDMVEGEAEIGNMFGVVMSFLTTLIRMTAGDRAAVECHLINDMVRIISSQYRHLSGIGEDLIFDHGRPTMERSWSSYKHEVLGMQKERDEVAAMLGDEIDRSKLEDDRVIGVGRSRFLEFIGFAGDFIHSFVADPPDALIRLAGPSTPIAAGKSWIHRNSDGAVIIQSTADIRLERVCRIPVPARGVSHEDPTVTRERKYKELDAAYLALPNFGTLEKRDAYKMAYHLRQYSRWLSRYHAFARMLQLPAEYHVPSEKDTTPSWGNKEEDKEAATSAAEYFDAYACITILRDGSIVLHDGYGSSVVMSNGNLQMSASRHIDIEAAGDIRMIAGGSLLMKARRNIELSATFGGIILHSYAWFKVLCEKGSVWLKSAASLTDAPTPAAAGLPVPELAAYDEGKPTSILIEAPQGNATLRTEGQITLLVDGGPANQEDRSKDIRLHTRGHATMVGKNGVEIISPKTLELSARQTVALSTSCIITSANQIYAGDRQLMYMGGRLFVPRLETLSLTCNGARSLSDKMSKMKDPIEVPAMQNDTAVAAITAADDLANNLPPIPWDFISDGPKWSFPAPSEYLWDTRDQEKGERPETLTQQYLRHDVPGGADQWGGAGYESWSLSQPLHGGLRSGTNGGFGYNEVRYTASSEGHNLHAPSALRPSSFSTVTVTWERSAEFTIQALKR